MKICWYQVSCESDQPNGREEWLKRAIDELDTRRMTPEERFQFARITAINAEAVNAEKQRVRDAVKRAITGGKLTVEEIASYNDVPIEVVLAVQNQLSRE